MDYIYFSDPYSDPDGILKETARVWEIGFHVHLADWHKLLPLWLLRRTDWRLMCHSLLNLILHAHCSRGFIIIYPERNEWIPICSNWDYLSVRCGSSTVILGQPTSLLRIKLWSESGTGIRSRLFSSSLEIVRPKAETPEDFHHWLPRLQRLLPLPIAVVCIFPIDDYIKTITMDPLKNAAVNFLQNQLQFNDEKVCTTSKLYIQPSKRRGKVKNNCQCLWTIRSPRMEQRSGQNKVEHELHVFNLIYCIQLEFDWINDFIILLYPCLLFRKKLL